MRLFVKGFRWNWFVAGAVSPWGQSIKQYSERLSQNISGCRICGISFGSVRWSLRKKRFKIGDRVKTSHGTGTVVEIDGEKYLVDLNGQSARLWTKDWALRKA
jgi:hypothetical protein